MTDETRLAFASLESRAQALNPPADRISLRDHVMRADIGAFQQERGHEQRLRFNVVVELSARDDAADDVDRILSYDTISQAIAGELAAERLNLLETLAERIAMRILGEPQAARVFVRIEKLDRGPGSLGVEIVRDKAGVAAATAIVGHRPVVVHLDDNAIAACDIAAWLDAAAPPGRPMIVTVGPPDMARPAARDAQCQQRIDLLSIEQNAWRLAAIVPECTVVATRTELDWAVQQGNRVIWAPSKLVLDTPGAPPDKVGDGLALAVWLAELLDASVLVAHGSVTLPAGCRVPVRHG